MEETSAETLCGAKLVDALQFVCGDITFRRLTSQSNSRRFQKRIVEECCFVSCNLQLLEQYCANPVKSKREAVPVPSPQIKDATRKHVTMKYSKYEKWQQNVAQRLRRGIPAILRTWTFRRPAEKLKAQ